MKLTEGSTVWLAWTFVEIDARDVRAYIAEATVASEVAKVVKVGCDYRQLHFGEVAFATEVEARSWAATQLEAAAEKIAEVARAEREKAAAVTAKEGVVYA